LTSIYKPLIDFIKRDEVNSEQAKEVVFAILTVFCFSGLPLYEIIELTENHIDTFWQNNNFECPLLSEE
jgi:hypothetical protein